MPPRTPNGSMSDSMQQARPPQQPSVWSFFRAFLRDRQKIGAVAPTSRGVGRRMAQLAGVHEARRVVEFGPGTGAITTQLLAALPPDGRLWAYEIHEPFLDQLRQTFHDPRLTLIGESAEAVRELRTTEAPEGFDAIVCSIPFSLLPPPVTDGILRAAADALRPGGVFVALQYHPTYLAPIMRRHFASGSREFFPWNVPPTMLLTGRGSRSTG